MMQHSTISCTLKEVSPHFINATITIPRLYVEKLYNQISFLQQSSTQVKGFTKGATPLGYIESNYQPHILDHLKEFFFKYFVIDWLYQEIEREGKCLAGEPRLIEIVLLPNQPAFYHFSLSLVPEISLQGWKRLPFKASKRKNYKDLDRQVKKFLKTEEDAQKNVANIVQPGDWVFFSVQVLTDSQTSLFNEYEVFLWLKIGNEESDIQTQVLFEGKKLKDVFITQHPLIQEYFSNSIETDYLFRIKIYDIVPFIFFDSDKFKKHFKIKNSAEVHHKLIEVFSYRNDISQRRTIVEESLKLLLSKYPFEIPNHLILRKQKDILDSIQNNPDYPIYKTQRDFQEKIKKLAVKQVKEEMLMSRLTLQEKITASLDDVHCYLNLTKRARIREFLYFKPPETQILGQENPLSATVMGRHCLQEKTLNYTIYNLIKQKTKKA
jgi:FKBP-type peptidyl-prolyl cis-trans isomerase (trigger factor)